MRGRRGWVWLAVGVLLLGPRVSAATATPARAEADKGVLVGGWTLKRDWSTVPPKPVWHGTATASNGQQMGVAIGSIAIPDRFQKDWHDIQLMDIGTVHVVFEHVMQGGLQQAAIMPRLPAGYSFTGRICICYEADQVIELTDSVLYKGTLEDGIKEAMATIEKSATAELLREMILHPVVLQEMRVGEGSPKVEVSIDGAGWDVLPSTASSGDWLNLWKLPLRPGQTLKVRLSGSARTVKATTAGFVTEPELTPFTGSGCSVGPAVAWDPWSFNKKGQELPGISFGPGGTAIVDCGALMDARQLRIYVRDWGGPGAPYVGNIRLRWGRSEEKWLDTGDYPLAGPVTDPSRERCSEAMLTDLESAYNPDYGAWFNSHGSAGSCVAGPLDVAALRGLDLSTRSQLKELVSGCRETPWRRLLQFCPYFMGSETRPTPASLEEAARRYLDTVMARSGGPLWQPLVPDGPLSWHDPSEVCGLAVIWRAAPVLRERIPLERILDLWAKTIPRQALPTVDPGLGDPAPKYDFEMLAHGVVALHIGWQEFHKPEYAAARDALFAEMLRQESQTGRYTALLAGQAWCSRPDQPQYEENWRPMLRFVSVFGQTCALIGNEEGLRHAQEWIEAALKRGGPSESRAYRSYEATTFADTCALIAVLRGIAPMYELPSAGQDQEADRLVTGS
jgi:hypothetical protein